MPGISPGTVASHVGLRPRLTDLSGVGYEWGEPLLESKHP